MKKEKTEKPDRMLAHLAVEMDGLTYNIQLLRESVDELTKELRSRGAEMVELRQYIAGAKTAPKTKAAGR